MKCLNSLLSLLLLGYFMGCFDVGEAAAQLIVVRPGYVRAPFVRVIRQSNGSAYVRAPFVRINAAPRSTSRSRRYSAAGRPLDSNIANSNTANSTINELSWDGLRTFIERSRTSLDKELSKLPTGGVWRSYFVTREAVLEPKLKGPPSDQEQVKIAGLLQAYDKAADNPDLQAITRLPTYIQLRDALRELVTLPVERMRMQVAISADRLNYELTRIRPSKRWQDYLAVPTSVTGLGGTSPSAINVEALLKTIGRYDAVVSDPDDAAIRALPSFDVTHRRMKTLARFVTSPTDRRGSEEIPAPKR